MTFENAYSRWAALFFVSVVILEIGVYWWRGSSPYAWRGSLASIGVGIGYRLVGVLKLGIPVGVLYVLWDMRIAEVPLDTVWGILLLFLGVEFAYYWFHRLSHEIRWMWATHAVHHSAEHLNILAAYRLGWTGLVSGGWLLFMPLIVLGFHPAAVLATLSFNLLYQAWIHTDLIPKLGKLEWVLNTPSHHRVHHATNADYLDRNYGGVLIIFDRLFGTYVEERDQDPCKYGLVTKLESNNPFVIAFHEWIKMAKDAATARTFRELAGYLFGPPGWKPDGKGATSEDIRREWRERHASVNSPATDTTPAVAETSKKGVAVGGLLLAFAIAGAALTTDAQARQPRAETKTACQSDFRTYCAKWIASRDRAVQCMRANIEKLSPACQAALQQEAKVNAR